MNRKFLKMLSYLSTIQPGLFHTHADRSIELHVTNVHLYHGRANYGSVEYISTIGGEKNLTTSTRLA